jgi:uncharacterized protein (DUF1330 family)
MKAYWIAHVDITDPVQYSQYTQRAPKALPNSAEDIGAWWAQRGMEGRPTPQRSVVIEFESYDQAWPVIGRIFIRRRRGTARVWLGRR